MPHFFLVVKFSIPFNRIKETPTHTLSLTHGSSPSSGYNRFLNPSAGVIVVVLAPSVAGIFLSSILLLIRDCSVVVFLSPMLFVVVVGIRRNCTAAATAFWCSSPATCPCCSALCVCYCSSVGAAIVACFLELAWYDTPSFLYYFGL